VGQTHLVRNRMMDFARQVCCSEVLVADALSLHYDFVNHFLRELLTETDYMGHCAHRLREMNPRVLHLVENR
jgi:methyl coenzyme M reductase subunit D